MPAAEIKAGVACDAGVGHSRAAPRGNGLSAGDGGCRGVRLTGPALGGRRDRELVEGVGGAQVDGQPDTGSPYNSVFAIITIIKSTAIKQKHIPINAAITSGTVENAVIPSKEYVNNFQKDHFVLPATLSTFSYSSHFVSNPTQVKIPFENLLYSCMETIASFICLVISLKSLAPSTISMFDIFLIIL